MEGGVALAFRQQQRKFVLREGRFILRTVQRGMPCAAVHLYPILIQHMMAYRLAAVQVGINEQIHLALVKLPRGVDDGDIVQQDLRKGRLQRAGRASISSAPIAGVVAIVITRCWCGLPVISSALRKASMPRLMY